MRINLRGMVGYLVAVCAYGNNLLEAVLVASIPEILFWSFFASILSACLYCNQSFITRIVFLIPIGLAFS